MSKSICSTGLRWLWVVVAVLIIDLGSKFLILQNFALGETVPLFPSLNLHYARNYGAAFSFLADSGGWQRWFFSGIAIGICVVLTVLMYRSKATQKLNNIAYALIIGGALGNLFDRLWHGFVVDMIDFYVGDWHFATFNLADSAICIGAAMIVLHFTLKLDDGSTAESTRNNGKPALFRLGDTSLSEGLEQQLLGLKEGEKKAFSLEPDAAFGVPSPDLIQYFSRREFIDAGEPEIGAIMLFTAMDGSEMPGVIREVNGDSITVDFNHPLAGRTVHFDIEVLEIDPALED